ncbi:MAG: Methionyl-tRNA formyltransferase [Chlamydiae bacterium]|nr:Methionyl-tRNA formyltransferase [Chlamydiota bacterium]
MKIIFFGTPQFASRTLAYLVDHGIDIVAVVTKPDKPVGRSGKPVPCSVKVIAQEKLPEVPLFQPDKASTPEFIKTLAPFNADVFVVVAYGEIINQELLDLPKKACINVHASLLPKYRGAAPIQRAIMEGEKETGVTIMHMVKKLDAGPMIKQVKVKIGTNTTSAEMHDLLQKAGAEALLQVLKEIEEGIDIAVIQDETEVTYAKKIELEDCEIDWSQPARDIHNLIRGVTPHPGAWCWVLVRGAKKRLKILSSRFVMGYTETPGNILEFGKEGIIVACGEESLRLLEVKLEGKRAMSAEEFACGLSGSDLKFL